MRAISSSRRLATSSISECVLSLCIAVLHCHETNVVFLDDAHQQIVARCACLGRLGRNVCIGEYKKTPQVVRRVDDRKFGCFSNVTYIHMECIYFIFWLGTNRIRTTTDDTTQQTYNRATKSHRAHRGFFGLRSSDSYIAYLIAYFSAHI